MHPLQRHLQFGEILGEGWTLTKRTAPTAGLLLFVIYMPLMLAVGFMAESMINGFASIAILQRMEMEGGEVDPDTAMNMMMPFFRLMFIIVPMSLVYQLLQPFGQTAATLASWEAINDRDLGFGEMLRRTFNRSFWYVVAQGLLIGVVAAIASGALMFVALLVGLATFGIGALVVYVAYYVAMIYAMVAIVFRIHLIVVEGRGPWQGLIASINLTKNSWWRVFGILLAIGAVTGILVIPILLPQIFSLVSSISTLPTPPPQGENDPEFLLAVAAMLDDAISPWTFAAFGLLIPAVNLFIINVLTTLYTDLRTRRGDFAEDLGEDDLTVTITG